MFATCFPDGTFPVLPSCMSKSSPPYLHVSSLSYISGYFILTEKAHIKEIVRGETE